MIHLLQAFEEVMKPINLFYLFIGTLAGIIAGCIPGLTFTTAIMLAFPFTFGMEPISGLTLMIGIYTGGASGGLIASTLIGIPGTPSSVTTMFDGYPMTLKGEPGRALGLGILSSAVGTVFGALILFFLGPLVAMISLKFGPWEVFSLVLFALTLIAGLSGKSLLKGLIAGLIGLLIGTIGYDPAGQLRFDFGMDSLSSGISPLPVLIGLFAMSQLMKNVEEVRTQIGKFKTKTKIRIPMLQVCKDLVREKFALFQSSTIGVIIGALPAAGAETAAFIAYDQAKRFSKEKDEYGKGHAGGIIASEASNNANAGGAFIPSITLGIPGDMAQAVMFGVLILHGITPGPGLFQAQPVLVNSIFVALMLSAFAMLFTQTALLPLLIRISYIPLSILVPSIIVCSSVGSFALNNQMFDVWMIVIFGLVGYVLEKIDVPLGPVILGLLLGPKAEEELLKAYQINPEITPFFTQPISLLFIVLSIGSIGFTLWQNHKEKKGEKVRMPVDI
ncbi:tripartite tricarboxylate transporter permease [Paenibacillus beijingensis]|uniref:Tat pathway signal protein n=1 Tax=Paenibacillus beijingensis TaxID=1126833 RepID=A0A0D5NR02_9BACL|nr:tripartite tricarboxylate transporter permease [Paenibacillus beijingensis]AJY77676.1 Tat pathway signal protein [Paenibacillus beijingensis]